MSGLTLHFDHFHVTNKLQSLFTFTEKNETEGGGGAIFFFQHKKLRNVSEFDSVLL